jgi:Type II restriction endonuclease, TdeIII
VTAETEQRVRAQLGAFLDTWIEGQYSELRQIEEEGYSPRGALAPFHEALVPGIRGLGERAFSTSLGNLHERIALTIAKGAHADANRAFDLHGQLPVLAREFITQRIGQLTRREADPDHAYERDYLLQAFGDEYPTPLGSISTFGLTTARTTTLRSRVRNPTGASASR